MKQKSYAKRSLAILLVMMLLLTSIPALGAEYPETAEPAESATQALPTNLREPTVTGHILDFATWDPGNVTDTLTTQATGPFASITPPEAWGAATATIQQDPAGFYYLRGASNEAASRELTFHFPAPETERVLVAFRVQMDAPIGAQTNWDMINIGGGTASDHTLTTQTNFTMRTYGNGVPGNARVLAHLPGTPTMQIAPIANTGTVMHVRDTDPRNGNPVGTIWQDVVIDFRMDGDRNVQSGVLSVSTEEALAGGDWLGNQYALYINGQRSFSPVAAQRPLEFYLWPNFGFRGTNNDREGMNFFQILTGNHADSAINIADVMIIGADDLEVEGAALWSIRQPDPVTTNNAAQLPDRLWTVVDGVEVEANVTWDLAPLHAAASGATVTLTGALQFPTAQFPDGVSNIRGLTPELIVTNTAAQARNTTAIDLPFFANPADIPLNLRPEQFERVATTIVAPQADGSLYYQSWDTHDSRARGAAVEADGRYVLEGNIMPDFSHVGFREGNEDIPFLTPDNSFFVTLSPNSNASELNCDTDRIHAAIAQVAAQPINPEHGFRGVVEFEAGTFWVTGARGIELNRSGVVLRGSGQGPDGTVIAYHHRPGHGPPPVHNWRNLAVAITIGNPADESFGPFNEGYFGPTNFAGSGTPYDVLRFGFNSSVVDGWYPTGSWELEVENAAGFEVGQWVSVRRVPTRSWMHSMNSTTTGRWGWPGMSPLAGAYPLPDNRPGNGPHTDVLPGGALHDRGELHYPHNYERRITAIDGNVITLNMPLVHGFNIPQDDTVSVYVIDETNRVTNVGVENLRIVSVREEGESVNTTQPTQRGGIGGSMSDNRGRTAIRVIGARDGFIRDTTSLYFPFAHTNLYHNTSHISVLNNSYLSPAVFQYSARLYGVTVDNGHNNLIDGTYSQAARYEVVTGAAVAGPNVFLDTIGEATKIGPENHHRFATGTLFDNVQMMMPSGTHVYTSNNTNGNVSLNEFAGVNPRIVVQNRGANGSGHGWTGATSVIWNSLAHTMQISRPPTGQNFLVGAFGRYDAAFNVANQGDAAGAGANALQTGVVGDLRQMYGEAHRELVVDTPAATYPNSLYRAQWAYRHTGDYRNALPSRPMFHRPAPDTYVSGSTFQINGIHDREAQYVLVFINGEFYDYATLGDTANRYLFTLDVTLPNGFHQLAVSQVIDGRSSHLTAQRTVHVGGVNALTNAPTPTDFVFTAQNAATQNMASQVNIRFHGNGGTPVLQEMTIEIGSDFADVLEEIDEPTRQNHAFLGWFTSPATTGGVEFDDSSVVPAHTLNLYARWSAVGGGGVIVTPPADDDDEEYEEHSAYMFGNRRGEFRPSDSLTRAEAAAILVRTQVRDFAETMNFLPPAFVTGFSEFRDVNPGDWFYFYVAWAYDADLIQGFGGAFRPNDPVTREELAAMIARTGDLRPVATPGFNDAAQISSWAMVYVNTVYRDGLMVGDTQGNFNPRANIIRAETATAMNRLLGRIDSRAAWDAAEIENLTAIHVFPDVGAGRWYYPAIVAATNDHNLTRDDNGRIDWMEILG